MKNRNVFLFLCGLALTLTMYNCQRVDEPLPTGPNADLLKGFTAIKMAPVDLVKPEAVVSTPSALLPATTNLDFRNGLIGSNGQLPAEFKKATDALSSSLSADDMDLLSKQNPSVVSSMLGGGALPENLKKVVERAESSAALSAYLTKAVLPTVKDIKPVAEVEIKEETTASNARTAASSNCKAQAQAAYEAKLDQLREERRQQLAAAQAQNAQAVAAANAAAATCKSNVSRDAERAAAQTAYEQEIAAINASNVSSSYKRLLILLANIRLYQALNAILVLEGQDRKVCDQIKLTSIIASGAALTANRVAIQDNFEAAVQQAKAERAAFIANCEYQQGQGS